MADQCPHFPAAAVSQFWGPLQTAASGGSDGSPGIQCETMWDRRETMWDRRCGTDEITTICAVVSVHWGFFRLSYIVSNLLEQYAPIR